MQGVSQKFQYALRALFELAKRRGEGVVNVGEIARAQSIPPRFLENILVELRRGEFVISRRGVDGGYMLARRPEQLAVGEVFRFIEGPIGPIDCVAGTEGSSCPFHGRCAFMGMWRQVQDAVAGVYDSTTFRDLLEAEAEAVGTYVADYSI